jgi:hypothetical protein
MGSTASRVAGEREERVDGPLTYQNIFLTIDNFVTVKLHW